MVGKERVVSRDSRMTVGAAEVWEGRGWDGESGNGTPSVSS